MKKQYPASDKSKTGREWNKHLKKDGKRRVNKSTRKVMKPVCTE